MGLLDQWRITAQITAVLSAIKIICWLAKEEVTHTTKYESLLNLQLALVAAIWMSYMLLT